jgi:hypothetical protein
MRRVRGLAAAVLAVLAAACGSGGGGDGGGGTVVADVEGRWLLTIARDGVDLDTRHVTVGRKGDAVLVAFTCDDGMPVGVGTFDGTTLDVTFDLGGGDAIVLSGEAAGWGLGGAFTAPDGPGTFWMGRTTVDLDCALSCEPVEAVRFVTHDFVDLDQIAEVSLFRSSAGHSYTDSCESCRSMKHYYAPFPELLENGVVDVFSPVTGTVVSVTAEGHGASVGDENKQVRIRSAAHPEYTFVLFHVDLFEDAVEPGDLVVAGQPIGTGRLEYPDLMEVAHDIDVGVHVSTLFGPRYVSFVETLTDDVFADYLARGASSRSDFVISEAARDADPLTCTDEEFTSTGSLPAWFTFPPP